MTAAQALAAYAARASFDDLSASQVEALKVRVLDALGCALGALLAPPVLAVRRALAELGGTGSATLIGGHSSAPDRAALFNGALVRYLDFNDAYLAKGETCHPSDNIAPVLAAAEFADVDGRAFLAALAVAYQVQCRLSDEAPVRHRGFDHTTQGSFAVAAGTSRALGSNAEQTANAIGIAGVHSPALRVTRTGHLSQWKGLAYPFSASEATLATFLARAGVTGPLEVFEGRKGFIESVSGPFTIDWSREGFDRIEATVLKRFDGEIHAQSAVEAVLELRAEHRLRPEAVENVEVDVFDVAYSIIGGGDEGDKTLVETREQADHSLPYMVAAALIDGELSPEQYSPERLARGDVLALLRRVTVRPDAELSRRFPAAHACRVRIALRDGRVLLASKDDYEGFRTRPMRWETAVAKFERLARSHADSATRTRIRDAVRNLDAVRVRDLALALARVPAESEGGSRR